MAHYRKIDVRIWNDKKFMSLSDDGKFVFLMILTHPNLTPLGAMRGSVDGLAHEIGWTTKRYGIGFAELLRQGMVVADEKACFVALPNFIKYNPPDNANVVKSWKKWVEFLPECPLQYEILRRAESVVAGLGDSFKNALGNGLCNGIAYPSAYPMPNREGEGEQEQKETKTVASPPVRPKFTPPTPQEVTEYAKSIEFNLDGHVFCDYYISKGWVVGKSKMQDWKASVRTWKSKENPKKPTEQKKPLTPQEIHALNAKILGVQSNSVNEEAI